MLELPQTWESLKDQVLVALWKSCPSNTGTSHTSGEYSGKGLALQASPHLVTGDILLSLQETSCCCKLFCLLHKDQGGLQPASDEVSIARLAPSSPTGPLWSNFMSSLPFQTDPKPPLRDCLVVETSVKSLPPSVQLWLLFGVLWEHFWVRYFHENLQLWTWSWRTQPKKPSAFLLGPTTLTIPAAGLACGNFLPEASVLQWLLLPQEGKPFCLALYSPSPELSP